MSARKRPENVHVKVLVSFNDVKAGDEAFLRLDARLDAWVKGGLVEVLDGTSTAGPGEPATDDHERLEGGAADSVPAGGEQGEGFGAGGYGAFA